MDFAFGVIALVLGYSFIYVGAGNLTGTPGEGPGFFEALGVPGASNIKGPGVKTDDSPTEGNQSGQTPSQPNPSPIPGFKYAVPGTVI